MEDLPTELISKIVSYLIEDIYDARKAVKELFNFFATCQRFNQVDLQSIFKSLAIELHPKLAYSKDRNLNWRTIVNAISSAYQFESNPQEAVDVARELVEQGILFPYYEVKYITSPIIALPIEEQRLQIREYLKKIPNINMIYFQYQTTPRLHGTILFHLCHYSAPFSEGGTYQITLLEELLAAGADPNIPALEGDYKPIYELIQYRLAWPIISVAYMGWYDAIDRLLNVNGIALDVIGGADVLIHGCSGELSPIHAACAYLNMRYTRQAEVLKRLLLRVGSCAKMAFWISPSFCLKYYTNPLAFKNEQNDVTALHIACLRLGRSGISVARPDLEQIRLLFEYGAEVNAQTTPDKFTPLHMLLAVVNDELINKPPGEKLKVGFDLRSIVKFLVQEKKANVMLKNSSGRSVLDYATAVQNIIDVSQSILDLLI